MADTMYGGLEWNPQNGRKGNAVPVDLDSIAHMGVVGPTGSGKGQFEIPNICSDGLRNCNIIGVDPTRQNKAVTGRFRSTFSDEYELNPFEVGGGTDVCCNPCLSVKTPDDAMRLAEAVEEVQPGAAHDPFWAGCSQGLIGGGIWGIVRISEARNETPTLPKVYEVLTTGLEPFAEFMAQNGDYALRALLTQYTKSNRTIDGIKMHAHNALKWLLSDPIRESLSVKKGEGIDWTQLKNGPRPLTVSLTLPIDKIVTHAPWLKVIVVDALNTLYRIGDVRGRKTVFMLSEFASYGRVQPIVTALGAGRKFGIRLCMVLQDSGQLESIYGKASATTIIGNSGCLLAFAPSPVDTETARWLSEAGGTHWVPTISASDDHHGKARVTVNEREEKVWPPDKIRRLPPFHALLFRSNMEPQPVYCAPYFKGELDRALGIAGRYDADPYHPASAVPKQRQVRKVTRAAAVAAAIAAGGVLLSHVSGHGGISRSPAPVVERVDDPPQANPPAHASPVHHRRHWARR
jgi:type IV secretory pathway TraG/TraD family ATPase VirD4